MASPALTPRPLRPPGRARDRHHGLDRARAEQVPRQDRLRSREAARLLDHRPRRSRGFPRRAGRSRSSRASAPPPRPASPGPGSPGSATCARSTPEPCSRRSAATRTASPGSPAARTTARSRRNARRRASRPRRPSTRDLERLRGPGAHPLAPLREGFAPPQGRRARRPERHPEAEGCRVPASSPAPGPACRRPSSRRRLFEPARQLLRSACDGTAVPAHRHRRGRPVRRRGAPTAATWPTRRCCARRAGRPRSTRCARSSAPAVLQKGIVLRGPQR